MRTAESAHDRSRSLRRRLPNRSLHLVDIENLVGHGRAGEDELAAAATLYMNNVRIALGDLIIIGCDRGLRLEIGLAWPGPRIVGGTGKDGAEKALLADVSAMAAARRFSHVVIGSGDHAFAHLVRDLRMLGTVVGVVSPDGSLARELAMTASWSRSLALLSGANRDHADRQPGPVYDRRGSEPGRGATGTYR